MKNLTHLYKSLSQRKRPEDIAEMIQAILKDDLSSPEYRILNKASKRSLKRVLFGYTSMAQEFGVAVGAKKQIEKTIEIFELQDFGQVDYNQAPSIEHFIAEVSPLINKKVGDNNFIADRLNKDQRQALGMDISKRNYNKKWRMLKRLENKLQKFQREQRKIEFQKIAKHGIIHHLDFDQFSQDVNTACFIAYFNARCNMRSVFTNGRQTRPFDEICEMLFNRCNGIRLVKYGFFDRKKEVKKSNATNWWAIAHIYTTQEVLSRLSDEQKGQLLGKWTNIIQDIAKLLGEIWNNSTFNRTTMIVRRGNDSTTWNNTAGAWNKARDNWMNLIYALGMDFILDELCFGKVMRLMAADVAHWHKATGGKLEPNTEVWSKLPLPWEVFEGKMTCTKNLVIEVCHAAGLDAEKSGWIAPRKHGFSKYRPTPELVHGVAVFNLFLATVLKRHKFYSGKNVKSFFSRDN